jgi:predicted regulator of Ras-like GTPase activity (Roadblock/LC7/MglB family)
MLRRVDAAQALADLTEISSQVIHVAIVGEDGRILATTIGGDGQARRFVDGIQRLLEEADVLRQARGLPGLAQLEAATLDGSVFVVRRDDRLIAATTRPDPTVGLVFYDLKHCLRSIDETSAGSGVAPRRPRRGKTADTTS